MSCKSGNGLNLSLACYIWVCAGSRLFFKVMPEIHSGKKEAEDGFFSVWLCKHICTSCFNFF